MLRASNDTFLWRQQHTHNKKHAVIRAQGQHVSQFLIKDTIYAQLATVSESKIKEKKRHRMGPTAVQLSSARCADSSCVPRYHAGWPEVRCTLLLWGGRERKQISLNGEDRRYPRMRTALFFGKISQTVGIGSIQLFCTSYYLSVVRVPVTLYVQQQWMCLYNEPRYKDFGQ